MARDYGIGIVGGGYMGKAHAVAMRAVAPLFDTALRPRLELVCATSQGSAERYRDSYGFARATTDWQSLVEDPQVDAVVVASPQSTHRQIAVAALGLGKPVLNEKPLGASIEDARAMARAASASGTVNMIGFNYMMSPASQAVMTLVHKGALGRIISFRAEHTEDFHADPNGPANWRSQGRANGNMGDLAPHIINAALRLMGPITSLMAEVETVHTHRPAPDGSLQPVTNDDQAHLTCRFESGVLGQLFISRVATGRKMGFAYEITGTKGAIRFDQEDQNAFWLYRTDDPAGQRGFRKILTGPDHPDYLPFCQGPGHGTGYQDLITIQASHFLRAIANGSPARPDFNDGLAVAKVVEAAWASHEARAWVDISQKD